MKRHVALAMCCKINNFFKAPDFRIIKQNHFIMPQTTMIGNSEKEQWERWGFSFSRYLAIDTWALGQTKAQDSFHGLKLSHM